MLTIKGTELQETTVCHAEENENINNITENWFDKKKRSPEFNFSLSPLKQINFPIYDDQKVSMSGIIENPMFDELVKKSFSRIIMMLLRNYFERERGKHLVSIYKSPLSESDMRAAKNTEDKQWLLYLNFDHHEY